MNTTRIVEIHIAIDNNTVIYVELLIILSLVITLIYGVIVVSLKDFVICEVVFISEVVFICEVEIQAIVFFKNIRRLQRATNE